jgi:hypothetical protein
MRPKKESIPTPQKGTDAVGFIHHIHPERE